MSAGIAAEEAVVAVTIFRGASAAVKREEPYTLPALAARIRVDRGKVRYAPILEWKNRETADRFSAAVIAVIEAQHRGATDEGAEQ